MDIKIVVATHKKYEMPDDEMYFPLHVGAEGKKDEKGNSLDYSYVKDNTGDNISEKNFCFGSQTGLYWAWKNLDAEYIGLVHYRRHFLYRKSNKKKGIQGAIKKSELEPMMKKYKVFVPKKRRYYIETVYSQYAHTLDGSHFDISRDIISEKCPEYLKAFDIVMNRTYGNMFNMMIMSKEMINDYCSWLFEILFELENRIDMTNLTSFEKRFCGRVSERLYNVWLEYQIETGKLRKDEIKELPYMENVNWFKKIKSFLMAKFFNKKYGASF